MVFAAFGVMVSVLARSSKAAMIWSLASGLILMPRFFIIIPESIGNLFHLSEKTVNAFSLLSPGIMLQALSNTEDKAGFITSLIGLPIGMALLFLIGYFAFRNQDEYNYGE
jgi:ABC-type transport system involved in multi-copper enzyme maturation permease subunit